MARNLKSLAALLSLAMLPVGAQAPKTAKDPQSSFEPRSQPGAGQKLLEKFAGDWDVVKTLYLRPGEPIRMTGTCRQTMRHDGRFLQSEFAFEQKGTKTTGLGLIGFEAETGKFTSVWTDSRSTRMSFRQSQDNPTASRSSCTVGFCKAERKAATPRAQSRVWKRMAANLFTGNTPRSQMAQNACSWNWC